MPFVYCWSRHRSALPNRFFAHLHRPHGASCFWTLRYAGPGCREPGRVASQPSGFHPSRKSSKPVAAIEKDPAIRQIARPILSLLVAQLRSLDDRVAVLDRETARRAGEDAETRRLMIIPGAGPITATALAALAPSAQTFKRGRDFAAWFGLTPLQGSFGPQIWPYNWPPGAAMRLFSPEDAANRAAHLRKG